MITKHPVRAALTGAALASCALFVVPAVASATTTPPAPATHASKSKKSFREAQAQLEAQLAARVKQLTQLSSDVTSSSTLSTVDASTLAARVAAASAIIDKLVTVVATDTTFAELDSARRTMIEVRVYAVLTPQVYEVIEADAIGAQVTLMQAGEPALLAAVQSTVGEAGHRDAAVHYDAYVRSVNLASTEVTRVSITVLAQVASHFPRNLHIFVQASHRLLNADTDLAHASFDASIIGLASGGYTGS
jgi:hypothetical protein